MNARELVCWRSAIAGILAVLGASALAQSPADSAPGREVRSRLLRVEPDKPNRIAFAPTTSRFIRLVIHESESGQPCVDELEVYGEDNSVNLALAKRGAKATASSCLSGYAIHQIAHLNDGLYGNGHSWIAAGSSEEWAQIELPEPTTVASIVFSRDREPLQRKAFAGWFGSGVECRRNPSWVTIADADNGRSQSRQECHEHASSSTLPSYRAQSI